MSIREQIERRRWQADHIEKTADLTAGDWNVPDMLRDDADTLEKLLAVIRQTSFSGVEFDDDRVSYLGVQIDRDLWNEIQSIAALEDE